MRWELGRVADLTAGEKAALRTLALAVYPPDVAAAWPGRAIEWAPHQWGVFGWGAGGAAPCYAGGALRNPRWGRRAPRGGGTGGAQAHPATPRSGVRTRARRR